MTSVYICNPNRFTVKQGAEDAAYPIMNIDDHTLIFKHWSQLRDLRDSINDALSEFEASEMKDVEVGQ